MTSATNSPSNGGTTQAEPEPYETDSDPEADDESSAEPDTEADADTDSEAEPEPLPLDHVFEVLKNQRRRYVLQYLAETDGPVSMSDLAEQVAAWENDKPVEQLTSSERKRVYVGLYQCHLPKMDGMDVVSFNKPRGVIERGPNAPQVEQYLHQEEDTDDWERYFVGLSAVSVGVMGLALALNPMTVIPLVDAAVLFVISLPLAWLVAARE
ncbi:MAG: hypothetical protein ABEI99_03100 [Halobaculum sp.]